MAVYIRFEYGQQDRFSEKFGPYEFVQVTYGSVRVGDDGDTFLAEFEEGLWVTQDGQKWSDFVVFY